MRGRSTWNPRTLALIIFLSLRGLRDNPLFMALLLLAVGAGVAFQIPNIANLAGYREGLLQQEVSAGYGHVRIRPREGERFNDAGEMIARIGKILGVEAVEPLLVLPGAVNKGSRISVLPVTGVNPAAKHHPYELASGADLAPNDEHGIVVGTRLARKIGASIGDDVDLQVLLATRPRLVLDDEGVGRYTMHIRGLAGFASIDQAFVSRDFLAFEVGEPGAASILLVYNDSPSLPLARKIAATIEHALSNAIALAWFDDSRFIRSAVSAIGAVAAIARGMSLAAVSIPVLALLYIEVLSRRRQISLLAAVGFRGTEIFLVFFGKALIVALGGVVLGGGLGYVFVRYFVAHPIYEYEKFVVRPVLTAASLLSPMLFVFVTTVLAGSIPAWQAARVDPSATLRRIE